MGMAGISRCVIGVSSTILYSDSISKDGFLERESLTNAGDAIEQLRCRLECRSTHLLDDRSTSRVAPNLLYERYCERLW